MSRVVDEIIKDALSEGDSVAVLITEDAGVVYSNGRLEVVGQGLE